MDEKTNITTIIGRWRLASRRSSLLLACLFCWHAYSADMLILLTWLVAVTVSNLLLSFQPFFKLFFKLSHAAELVVPLGDQFIDRQRR